MDFRFTPEQERLRAEVRDWLAEHLPEDFPRAPGNDPEYEPPRYPEALKFAREFNQRLAQRGWLTAHWPQEYGGMGLGVMEQVVLREELAWRDAPILNAHGLNMVGPILMRFGSEEQKARHLPGMATCEVLWAQGYSEPNAGSDLAAVEMRAVRDGDEYVLNGTKIWTSHGYQADWMFLLARTDPDAPKHRGISFLLLDMHSPGVTLVPIPGMHGYAMGCQEYFEDVRIPVDNLVGEENRGWYAGAALLDFERSGITTAIEGKKEVRRLVDYYQTQTRGAAPALADREHFRYRLADHQIEADVGRYFSYRIASMQERGQLPNYEASMGKVFHSELMQRLARSGFQMAGLFGQAGAAPRWDDTIPEHYRYQVQWSLIKTIGAGTSEIQRNIIATRGFGLPRS